MINSNEIIRGCSLSEARYMLDHFYGRTVELVSYRPLLARRMFRNCFDAKDLYGPGIRFSLMWS